MELTGQGSDWNHSLSLRCSCGNAGSLTHCVPAAPTTQGILLRHSKGFPTFFLEGDWQRYSQATQGGFHSLLHENRKGEFLWRLNG